MRGQVATLETHAADAQRDVATLQKSASNAKAAQQTVEVELAKQQERTALAEAELLRLRRSIDPRSISSEQRSKFLQLLDKGPKGPVSIRATEGDFEGEAYAEQFIQVLKAAGWPVDGEVSKLTTTGASPIGLGLLVRSKETASPYAWHLRNAMIAAGFPVAVIAGAQNIWKGDLEIIVGHKPPN